MALVCVGIVSGLIVLVPLWSKTLIKSILPKKDLYLLGKHLVTGFFLAVVLQIFLFGQEFIRMRLSHRISAKMRMRLYEKIVNMPINTIPKHRTGDLISRLSNDILVFQNGIKRGVFQLLQNGIFLICLIILMFFYSLKLSFITLIILPSIAGTVYLFIGRIRKKATKVQEQLALLNNIIGETIRGLKEIKSFRQEEKMKKCFSAQNEDALRARIEMDKTSALHPAIVLIVTLSTIALLLFFCSWLVIRGSLALENLAAFLTCLLVALSPIQEVSRSFGFISRLYAVMDRFNEIFNAPSESTKNYSFPALPKIKGHLRFDGVNFKYDSNFELKNVNLDISAGETVAIVGPSGAGKTTLFNLILRFLEPNSGVILFDGLDPRLYSISSLRKQIGLVPQEPVLFFGTLMENLAFARPGASKKEILDAAKAAHVDEFALGFSHRYETHIGQYGSNLSVGQRQRIAIARALILDPRILMMDEPTSALDLESEHMIQDSLNLLYRGRTTLIAAHRMSTIRHADRIIVLDKGRIAETGSHDELIKNKALYFKLFSYQTFL